MLIAVTGATGYIGAHVVKALAERGHEIIATDFNEEQNQIAHYCKNYYHYDIRHYNGKFTNVDKTIHIAAKTKVGPSVADPWNYYSTNVNGTKHVMTAFDCEHFVYCSTGSAFQPEASPYAASKYAGELITKQFYEQHSIVRFYNVSGNDGMYKFDDEMSHLIRKAARVANKSNGHPLMTIFGTDYNTRDGTCIRNYTHVKDIVDGLVRIAESPPSGKIDCLGSPDGVTVKEVIDTMKKVSGVDFPVEIGPRRKGDIEISTVPEASKFFTQSRSLEDMCKDALVFEK